jgi:hypothetical protein
VLTQNAFPPPHAADRLGAGAGADCRVVLVVPLRHRLARRKQSSLLGRHHVPFHDPRRAVVDRGGGAAARDLGMAGVPAIIALDQIGNAVKTGEAKQAAEA